jgi:hypothetical protein
VRHALQFASFDKPNEKPNKQNAGSIVVSLIYRYFHSGIDEEIKKISQQESRRL